ncbi:MAG: aminotransferase class I/II-fold pyridoxal phosphate-dependent enzyme [Planctomycetota bacterium]|jgi:8-amino-7-oxononanoate synthase
MDKFTFLQDELSKLQDADLLRKLRCISSVQGPIVRFEDGEAEKILFCSNNYLNLAGDKRVIAAAAEAMKQYGCGAAASRLVSGTMRPHVEVEKNFADFFGTESSLLFSSGWTANEAVLRTIPQKGDIVLLDKFDHASIIDATRAGQAQFRTYRPDRLDKLEKFLADKKYNRRFIVTESIFSMDGNAADLARLVELKNAYDAILIVDEAHAVGCMGETGAGLAEALGLLGEVDIIIAPLGKAFAATGSIVAGPKAVIDYLVNKARAFIYTTAPSPANCAAISAALEIVKTEPQRRQRLAVNAEYLRSKLSKLGLDTGRSSTHIVPVITGPSKDTLAISKVLYERGFFIAAIRPPTVPRGTARLRISVQSDHITEQLDALVDAIEDASRIAKGAVAQILSTKSKTRNKHQ